MAGYFVAPRRCSSGFSMIEVLIALIVLAIGLLGLALLQTMNLRFTQSANHRSIAVNLAYELLDYTRANRINVQDYLAITPGSFASVPVPATGCARTASLTPADNIAHWRCEVREALGANAQASFLIPAPGQVSIAVSWGETPWDGAHEYTLVTQL